MSGQIIHSEAVQSDAPDASPGIAMASITLYQRPNGQMAIEALTLGDPDETNACHRLMGTICNNLPVLANMAQVPIQDNYATDPLPEVTHQSTEVTQ
ncbi:MAG: hypothetical protein JO269_09575 [Burkholderiaceae bacterium]|nr:hypothetical protein [Burkholderiaceae bacterium]